ncbi:4844_t:CDS:2, partial [Acaulospora colombiana]
TATMTPPAFLVAPNKNRCAGCEKMVAVMEPGVVPGPNGSRWHASCLVCGGKGVQKRSGEPGCGKKLDRDAKLDPEGKTWCSSCMTLLILNGNVASASTRTPVSATFSGATPWLPIHHTGASSVSSHTTGSSTSTIQDAPYSRPRSITAVRSNASEAALGMLNARNGSTSPTKGMLGGTVPVNRSLSTKRASRPRPKSVSVLPMLGLSNNRTGRMDLLRETNSSFLSRIELEGCERGYIVSTLESATTRSQRSQKNSAKAEPDRPLEYNLKLFPMSTTCLGPFKAIQFLVPPSDLASAKVLPLEEFALEFRDITVGLDLVHDDDKILANMVVEEGLMWRGIVHFVNTAGNKKQISREGMQLLTNKAQEKDIRIDWEKGFDVILEGLYWRHTTALGPVSAPSLKLFIDMKQVASTSGSDDYRRFEVITMHPLVRDRSQKVLVQSRIIHIMESINRNGDKTAQRKKKTIPWYELWYQRIFSALSQGSEPPFDHLIDSHLPSLTPEIAKHLESESFCAIMSVHKGLVTKANLVAFRCSIQTSQESPEKDEETVWVSMDDGMSIIAEQDHPQDVIDMDQDLNHEEDNPMDLDQGHDPRTPSETDIGPIQDIIEVSEDDSGSHKSFPLSMPSSDHTSKTPSDLGSLDLLSMVPREMFEPVTLGQNCQWYCPIRQCQFSLNLRSTLPYKMLQQLDGDDKLFLQMSSWTSRSPIAASILNKMCSSHYIDHLQQIGLTMSGVSDSLGVSLKLTGSQGQIRRLD